MKKFKSHLQRLFLLVFVSLSYLSFTSAQTIQSSNISSDPAHYGYSINNLPNGVTSAFWVLGDGHFRSGLAIDHRFKSQANDSVQVYLLESYKPVPPPRLMCGGCNGIYTSMVPNPVVGMTSNQPVKIGTSWNPVRGEMHYTILTFENTNGAQSGKIELSFGSNVDSILVESIDNNADWVENLMVNTRDLEFDFINLYPGQQRHLLIRTFVNPYLSTDQLNYFVRLSNTGNSDYNMEANGISLVRRYPHDPNDKTVDIVEMCSYNLDPTTLEYTIRFQNIGIDYATVVEIDDELHPDLDLSSIQIINSSDLYQFYLQGSQLKFVFDPILLPGLDQTIPYIPHPNETIGFITFTIKTNTCLPEGVIENQANIRFDNLGDIVTNTAETHIDYFEDCNPAMDACANIGIGNDDDPTDDGDGDGDGGDGNPGEDGWEFQGTSNNGEVHENDRVFSKPDDEQFGIYPNPVNEFFTISFALKSEQSQTAKLIIYNAQGAIVNNLSDKIQARKGKQQTSINASTWSKGIYFVKLEDTNEIHTWKLIKL